jgi:hypothetical protein
MANTSLKCVAAASEIAIGVKNRLRCGGPIADKFSANLAQLLRSPLERLGCSNYVRLAVATRASRSVPSRNWVRSAKNPSKGAIWSEGEEWEDPLISGYQKI